MYGVAKAHSPLTQGLAISPQGTPPFSQIPRLALGNLGGITQGFSHP